MGPPGALSNAPGGLLEAPEAQELKLLKLLKLSKLLYLEASGSGFGWPLSLFQRPLEASGFKVLKILKVLIPGASGPPEGLQGHLRGLLEAPGNKTFKTFKTFKIFESGGLHFQNF